MFNVVTTSFNEVVKKIEESIIESEAYTFKKIERKNAVEFYGNYDDNGDTKSLMRRYALASVFKGGGILDGTRYVGEVIIRENGGFNILLSRDKSEHIKGLDSRRICFSARYLGNKRIL